MRCCATTQAESSLAAGQFGAHRAGPAAALPRRRSRACSSRRRARSSSRSMTGGVVNLGRSLECVDRALGVRIFASGTRWAQQQKNPGAPLPAKLAGLLREAKWLLLRRARRVPAPHLRDAITAPTRPGRIAPPHAVARQRRRRGRAPGSPTSCSTCSAVGVLVGRALPATSWSGATAASTAGALIDRRPLWIAARRLRAAAAWRARRSRRCACTALGAALPHRAGRHPRRALAQRSSARARLYRRDAGAR